MIKTNAEVREMIIDKLEGLIIDIKKDKTGDNYSFKWTLLSQYNEPDRLIRNVMFCVKRTEYKTLVNER